MGSKVFDVKMNSGTTKFHTQIDKQLVERTQVTVNSTSFSGYLTKLGKVRKNWLGRWFVLHYDQQEICYYTSDDQKVKRGTIPLNSITTVTKGDVLNVNGLQIPSLMIVTPHRNFQARPVLESDVNCARHANKEDWSSVVDAWISVLSAAANKSKSRASVGGRKMVGFKEPVDSEGSHHTVKMLLLGNLGVGKTSLLTRFCNDTFAETTSTVNQEQFIHTIKLDSSERAQLDLVDTVGQERFRTVTSLYYRGAAIVMVCFSKTDPESFKNIRNWLQEVDRYADESCKRVLVGTKSDLEEVVSTDEASEFASSLDIRYFETSAKDDTGIQSMFKKLAEDVCQPIKGDKKSKKKKDKGR